MPVLLVGMCLVGTGLLIDRTEQASYFKRFQPSISHVRMNSKALVNRIVRWASNISHGKEDIRQTKIDTEFIEGGTVGPAPK